MSLPYVACLCPVFRQTKWLNSALKSYEDQTYPDSHRELLILDDSGEMKDGFCSSRRNSRGKPLWSVISLPERLESIPDKYSYLVNEMYYADVYCVWDALDLYLPWHIESVATVCPMRGFVIHENQIVSYGDTATLETGNSRCHGSLAISRHLLDELKGWPSSRTGRYEQDMLADLSRVGHCVRHQHKRGASYVWRHSVRKTYLGKAISRALSSAFWYEDVERNTKAEGKPCSVVPVPAYDAECESIIDRFSY